MHAERHAVELPLGYTVPVDPLRVNGEPSGTPVGPRQDCAPVAVCRHGMIELGVDCLRNRNTVHCPLRHAVGIDALCIDVRGSGSRPIIQPGNDRPACPVRYDDRYPLPAYGLGDPYTVRHPERLSQSINTLGLDVLVVYIAGVRTFHPRDNGTARSITDERRPDLCSGSRRQGHPVRCPERFSGTVDTLHEQVGVAVSRVYPDIDRPACPV